MKLFIRGVKIGLREVPSKEDISSTGSKVRERVRRTVRRTIGKLVWPAWPRWMAPATYQLQFYRR